MNTQIIQPNPETIVRYLKEHKLVAIPTDTVYGLAVLADDQNAIERLRAAKNRPQEKALAYVVDAIEKIKQVCHLTQRDIDLINLNLPGPITFIFNKKENTHIFNESDLTTLAIRIPNHPLILQVLSQLPVGIYLPSANLSGHQTATTSMEVHQQLGGRIDAIVEGVALGGQASTIIDCTQEELKVVRPGPITLDKMRKTP